MTRVGLTGAKSLSVMLAGVVALGVWFVLGSSGASAQTIQPLDPANCDEGGIHSLSIFATLNAEQQAVATSECKSLVAVRNHFFSSENADQNLGTTPESWGVGDHINVDSWTGVFFSSSGRVRNLNLFNNMLTGTIPAQLGELSDLKILNLGGNQFTGEIPSGLGDLTQVTDLNLAGSQLTGEIPPELDGMTALVILDLAANQLTGSIPSGIGSLANLTEIYLGGNQLSGGIPDTIGSLASLQVLSLGGNRLTGPIPPQIVDLSQLTDLTLSNNQLTGPIPDQVYSLTSLNTLNLAGNQLTGTISTLVGNLVDLTFLSVGGNQIAGTIPTQVGDLTSLTSLDLSRNRLTGTIPSLSGLSRLFILKLDNNRLTQITDLDGLTRLTFLNLSNNRLSGELPDLGHLTFLRRFVVSNNRLSGEIPGALGSLPLLTVLDLGGNRLSGRIPVELGGLSATSMAKPLVELYLHSNQLTGEIPAALGDLSNLQILYLCNNSFSGVAESLWPFLRALGDRLCLGSAPVVRAVPGNGQVVLHWTFDELEDEFGAESFEFRHRRSGGDYPTDGGGLDVWESVPGSEATVTVTGLTNGQRYYFQVRARLSGGGHSFPASVSAVPGVGSTADEEDYLSRFSACAGVDVAASDFEDIEGSFARTEIACMEYYGITLGRTSVRFAPSETLSRWQMALFLARAAGPAGVELVAIAPDQGFTDIDGLSTEAQRAANSLALAGIMPGVSDTRFDPNGLVSRGAMALWLDRFLDQAVIGTGGIDPDTVFRIKEIFTDIDGMPKPSVDAIRLMHAMGITRGRTPTTYGPQELVTRAQMAMFIARMLSHTRTQPAGITIQTPVGKTLRAGETVDVLVSVRDGDFQPVVGSYVDMFSYSIVIEDDAFDPNGHCTDYMAEILGADRCKIDSQDPQTNQIGDILLEFQADRATEMIAWIGQTGDTYDPNAFSAALRTGR